MDKTITYLEMTAPSDLQASRPVAGLALQRLEAGSPLIPDIQARIGAPFGWRSAARTESEWATWLAHPLRQYWLITHHGAPAGILNLEPQPDGDVEITTFGLLPEHHGHGLGGAALNLAVRQAWATTLAGEGEAVRRVWLHTSSLDHPNALTNYQRRGFRIWRTETLPQTD
ncbi:GNAT family N-acetyltransferase [Streptacidiphilus sp. PAMC 29251]